MDFLKILYLSSGSVIVLFILTKIMGNKEMAQLTMFDYIVGITIGSIAAEMATSLENSFTEPLIAMIVYAIFTVLISFISTKSIRARKFLTGISLILLDNGKLYKSNFKKAKLDINEFLVECRTKGYFNLSDIQTAILEPNGKLSILPVNLKRPATAEDLNLNPSQEKITTQIVIDGRIIEDNLKALGFDKKWLFKELKKQGFKDEKNIFLALYNKDNNLSIWRK
ncbi:MAG: DUF421 domain-containing protein [Clostridia bacterium]|nr:DUF421 domain-containing protein [Clostridia bacterium]